MSAIFLSHSSRDNAVASEFRARLEGMGHRSVFLDFDPEHGIPAGRDWARELYNQLRGCRALIVLCSEHSMASRWCFVEVTQADALGKEILPVKISPCKIDATLMGKKQAIDYLQDPEEAYRKLRRGLEAAGLDPTSSFDWDGSRPPYPGLSSFEEDDAAVFLGRNLEIEDGLEKLRHIHRYGKPCLLLVLGPSGSGKSSLVRAGLVPQLRRAAEPWLIIGPFKPKEQPFQELAVALAAAFRLAGEPRDWKMIRGRLEGDASATTPDARVLKDLLMDLRVATGQQDARALIVLDQAEELLVRSGNQYMESFLCYLRAALDRATEDGLLTMATLRSDYLGVWQSHPATRELEAENLRVDPMAIERMPEVIEGPAHLVGLELEPGLTQTILAEAKTEKALPLLAFSLRELFDRHGADGLLEIQEFTEKLGGLRGSVARAADDLMRAQQLSESQEAELRSAFLAMARLNENDSVATRRRVRWKDLPEGVHEVLEEFVKARLLVSDKEGSEGRTVEVAHETLFESWDRLRSWLEEDRDFLAWRRRLSERLREWDRVGPDRGELLMGAALGESTEWLERRSYSLSDNEKGFIRRSARKAEEDRDKHRRRLMKIAGAMTAAALAFAALAVWAVAEWRIANRRRLESDSRRLAVQAQVALGTPPPAALELAIQAVQTSPTFEAVGSLRRAVREPAILSILRGHLNSVWSAEFSPAGDLVLTASQDETARLWEVSTGREIALLEGHEASVVHAVFGPKGDRVATASVDGTARIWEAPGGTLLHVLGGHSRSVWHVAFSPDGERVVTSSDDGTARVWEVASGRQVALLQGHTNSVRRAAYSPKGDFIVTASLDGTARVWEAAGGAVHAVLLGHSSTVWHADFDPQGNRVVTASDDWTARVWDSESGNELSVLEGHTNSVGHAVFSPEGGRVLTSSLDGTARIWEPTSGDMLTVLDGHDGSVGHAEYSSSARLIVTASDDGTARLWSAASGTELAVLEGHRDGATYAVFSPGGERIATTDFDGEVLVWHTASGHEISVLEGHRGEVGQADFGPQAKRVVTSSGDGTARVWEVASGKELAVLEGHADSVAHSEFSPDGDSIITASWDRTARVWDASNGDVLLTLDGHTDAVRVAAFDPEGERVVTASLDDTARVWDARTGGLLAICNGHSGDVSHASFGSGGDRIVTASLDGTARVWEASSGKELLVLEGHRGDVLYAVFSTDGNQIVTASSDRTARVWDSSSGRELAILEGHMRNVLHASFDRNGDRIVTASSDGTARLWDASSGEQLAVLEAHEEGVVHAVFSPRGDHIVTSSLDDSARIWASSSGEEIAVLEGHTSDVMHSAFSVTGDRILTASLDGTVRLYFTEHRDLEFLARSRLPWGHRLRQNGVSR